MPKIISADKELIVKITKQLIQEERYDEINCRSIASLAGIGVGTLYHFFKSKVEIIAYIIFDDWKEFNETLNIETTLKDGLNNIYNGIKDFSNKYYNFWHKTKDVSNDYISNIDKHGVLVNQIKGLLVRLLNYNSLVVDDDYLLLFITENIVYYASRLYEYANIEKYLLKLLEGEQNG